MIPTYCIAHREPRIAAHLYDAVIHTPPRPDYEALASVVAHPVIARLAPTAGLVNICGYRKIMLRAAGGKPHERLSIAQCAKVPRDRAEPYAGFEFLLCAHNFFQIGRTHKNIGEQWAACHHKEDLRDGLDLAEELGVLSGADCRALEVEPMLIEGGCCMGVFPGALVREIFCRVWPLYQAFASKYRARILSYDPMQRRCIAFLAERIETHFILAELRRRYPGGDLPRELFGCLTSAWDGPWEAGTHGAAAPAPARQHIHR